MANTLTKQAALNAGSIFDNAANEVEKLASLGVISGDIARKFAYQCDLLADHTAKKAGLSVAALAKSADEDPEQIGKETAGPHEGDSDESYMKDEFTQQERRELREKVQNGDLSNDKADPVPKKPEPGKQASLEAGQKLASLFIDINKAATKCASSENTTVQGLGDKLASAGLDVLQFQTRLMEGSESIERVAAIVQAANHFLPHLAGDVTPVAATKLARMAEVFSGFAAPKAV